MNNLPFLFSGASMMQLLARSSRSDTFRNAPVHLLMRMYHGMNNFPFLSCHFCFASSGASMMQAINCLLAANDEPGLSCTMDGRIKTPECFPTAARPREICFALLLAN